MVPRFSMLFMFIVFLSFPIVGQQPTVIQQPVAINDDGSVPDSSAMLHVQSLTRGMLMPAMTSAQRMAIDDPADGLLVFDTDTKSFWFFDGLEWIDLSAPLKTLTDMDEDTKIEVEKTPDEDTIRFTVGGFEMAKMDGKTFHLQAPGNSLFIGLNAGSMDDGTNNYNLFLGPYAGMYTVDGSSNTFIGALAGANNVSGYGNIFLGSGAGFNELGNNRLYIENSASSEPLVYGEFDNDLVRINGRLEVGGDLLLDDSDEPDPQDGLVRWNEETGDFEGYADNQWKSLTYHGNTWGIVHHSCVENQQVIASDIQADALFGYSVDMYGEYAIVGARDQQLEGDFDRGQAYILQRSGNDWNEVAILRSSDGDNNDLFGWSVAISADYAAVGATSHDTDGNNNQGKVYVFAMPGSGWSGTLTETAQLKSSDGASGDEFGGSVSISDDQVIVGAEEHDTNDSIDRGKTYVFVKPGGGWSGTLTESGQLISSDGASLDHFGGSVCISGDYAIAGARVHDTEGDNNRGKAYIYKKPPGGWSGTMSESAQLIASDGTVSDAFGVEVKIFGETAVVGAYWHDTEGDNNRGKAYVFNKPGGGWTGTLTEDAQLVASDGDADDFFARSISIHGHHILVGAYGHDPGGGKAYLFARQANEWNGTLSEFAQFTSSDGESDDFFGRSLAIYGDHAVIGAEYHDTGVNNNQGKVYFFHR